MKYHHEQNDLLFIRHAQSQFNKGYMDYLKDNDLDIGWDQAIQNYDFNEAVSYNDKYIDCSITPHGVKQCKSLRDKLKNTDIDLVLVSPMQRALETCNLIFGDRKIPIIVHPTLTEVFRYSCDVSHQLEGKKQQFSHFNWIEMEKLSDLWFIEHLSQKNVETCKSNFQNNKINNFQQKQLSLVKLLAKQEIFQSAAQIRQRAWRLKKLIQSMKQKHSKIAVVAHYYTIQATLAQQFDHNHEIKNFIDIENCSPYWTNLPKLLKIR